MQKSVFLQVSPIFKAILNCIFLLVQKTSKFFRYYGFNWYPFCLNMSGYIVLHAGYRTFEHLFIMPKGSRRATFSFQTNSIWFCMHTHIHTHSLFPKCIECFKTRNVERKNTSWHSWCLWNSLLRQKSECNDIYFQCNKKEMDTEFIWKVILQYPHSFSSRNTMDFFAVVVSIWSG